MIPDSERSVLGSALIDPVCVPVVCGELVDADFTATATVETFRAINALWKDGTAIDLVTVSTELERRSQLARVGGLEFLTDLVTFVPTSANVRFYIEALQNARKVRTFSAKMRKSIQEAESGEESYIDTARAVIDEVGAIGSSGVTRLSDCFPEVTNRLGDTSKGIMTGFTSLDAVTRGFYPGRLYIVAARPGIGKTAIALNMAANMSRYRKKVAVFSLEMSAVEVAERVNLSEAMVDPYSAYRGESKAIDTIFATQSRIAGWNLFIDDRASLSVGQLVAGCYKIKQAAGGLDCVFIDYLQLLRVPQRQGGTRAEDLGIVTRALKILSRELQCPVVVLAQLNRSSVGRRPVVSDLRESGSIEQDADVVLLLYRESEEPDCKEATLIVGKNRHGRTGDINLVWNAAWTRYTDEAFKDVPVPKGLFDKEDT